MEIKDTKQDESNVALKPKSNDLWTLEKKYLALKNKGCNLARAQKNDEALNYFEQALVIKPNDLLVLNYKAGVLIQKGERDNAIMLWDQILLLDPKNIVAWKLKGRALIDEGNDDQAIICFDKVLEIDPNDINAWRNKGSLLKKKSQYEAAKGDSLYNKGQYDAAIQCCNEALAIDPQNTLALLTKSSAFFMKKQYGSAIHYYHAVLAIDPQNTSARKIKNQFLERLYLAQEYNALSFCCKIPHLAIDPQYIFVVRDKGYILEKKEQCEVAIRYCSAALANNSQDIDALQIKSEALRLKGHYDAAIQCCDEALAINPQDDIALRRKGAALSNQGKYPDALKYLDLALKIDPDNRFALDQREIAFEKLQYPTPFKLAVEAYDKMFLRPIKRTVYASLIAAANNIKQPPIEQLCDILQHLFTLKFLEAEYLKNDNGSYRLLPAREGEEEKLLKNVLTTWVKEKKTITEQYRFIECLTNLYLKNWFDEGWLDADSWFVIDSQEIEPITSSLIYAPCEFDFCTLSMYEDFLLFVLRIDAGFEKESAKQGITSRHLCDERESVLKTIMLMMLEKLKEKYFEKNLYEFAIYLDSLKEKEKKQFSDLRQKQLGRPCTSFYMSRLPTVKAVLLPEIRTGSVHEKIEEVSANLELSSSVEVQEPSHEKSLIPPESISEEVKMNELLNRIDTDGNDTKDFGGIFISRRDVRFNCFDKDSDYTADFINLLLYPLKESHLESIAIYPVTTLKEFPKYFEDIEAQKQRYAFITLHVPYNPESPIDNNHWAVLIIDKQEQVIFYLDPATVGTPQAIEDLKTQLKYEKPIAINTINFQQAEMAENKIRHCGVYVVEIFKVFAQCIRNHQTIVDTKSPIKSLDKEHVSLTRVLKSIPCGLNEAAVHRQTHIDTVCKILERLPPVKPIAASEQQKKRPLAIVKTDPDEMIQFCFRINVMGDKAQLAIIAFHEVLLGRLESRKTTSEVMNSGIISYTEKGNWSKLKKAGWMILKSAPIAGKVLKYGHVGCQVIGECFDVVVGEASWIEPVTEYLEYVKSGSKVGHAAIEFLDDHWESFKGLHNKVDDYFRKWIDGSEVDTHREYKQFYGIFRTDAGKDALNRFVHSLIDRYARQLQLLEPKGAKQLAKAIGDHLSQLFLLDFTRWNLSRYGAQKHAMMLEIMRQWVTYMGFQKEKKVLLASGETATAEALLQHCGVYFEGDKQPVEINVMMDWDVQTKSVSMTNSGRYGYRKAESLLVEEFKGHLQNSGQLLQAYEVQFISQKTTEELEIFKELGHVMGIQFDSRTLSAFQQVKDVKACEEVVWQSLQERTQANEERLEDIAETMGEVKGEVKDVKEGLGTLKGRMDSLQEEVEKSKMSPKDIQKANNLPASHAVQAQDNANTSGESATQESLDKANEEIEKLRSQVTVLEDKIDKAAKDVATANKAADAANETLTEVQNELQEEKKKNGELGIKVAKLERTVSEQDRRLAKIEQHIQNHVALPLPREDEAEPPIPINAEDLEENIVVDKPDNQNISINGLSLEMEVPVPPIQNFSKELTEQPTGSNCFSSVFTKSKDLQKDMPVSAQNTDVRSTKISPENINLKFQPVGCWR